MKIVIGLTGPTGAGKSSACNICESLGLRLIDCDKIARQAVEKGSNGLKALVNAFGNCILNPDGTLNRRKLASIAFASKEQTQLLNDTTFPYIKELVLKGTQNGNTLLDAPTLFESGINEICFKTIAILCDKQTRLARIIARDNLTKEDALLRINAGKDDDFYIKNADYIIHNNGGEDELIEQFTAAVTEILKLGENL
jgi:dephospho-CoA kinase